jgi:drug/metabolite transporter (DMT)-like permease
VARLGLRTNFTPWDIAALRFGVGGLLLLPYLWRKGFAIERLGWMGLAALVLGCGAPMVLLVNAGLLFAPAAHAGALFSGVVPMRVALLAAPILHEACTSAKRVGLTLVLTGVIAIVWSAGGTIGTQQNIGHVLFLGGALLWACYTVAMSPPSRLSFRANTQLPYLELCQKRQPAVQGRCRPACGFCPAVHARKFPRAPLLLA